MEDIAATLTEKTEQLKQAIDLRSAAMHDDTTGFVSTMLDLNHYLTDVEGRLADLQHEVEAEKRCIQKSKALRECMVAYTARLGHIKNNLPAHLPGNSTPNQPIVKEINPPPTSRGSRAANKENKATAGPKKKAPPKPLPTISFVTTDEFNSFPKYMVGRIDRNTINATVEEFNKTLAEKYKIIRMSKQKMDQFQRKQWQNWKDQETDATAGLSYTTEADLKLLSDFKSSKQSQNILVMLRHLKLIKEVRGGGKGIVRYVVL